MQYIAAPPFTRLRALLCAKVSRRPNERYFLSGSPVCLGALCAYIYLTLYEREALSSPSAHCVIYIYTHILWYINGFLNRGDESTCVYCFERFEGCFFFNLEKDAGVYSVDVCED